MVEHNRAIRKGLLGGILSPPPPCCPVPMTPAFHSFSHPLHNHPLPARSWPPVCAEPRLQVGTWHASPLSCSRQPLEVGTSSPAFFFSEGIEPHRCKDVVQGDILRHNQYFQLGSDSRTNIGTTFFLKLSGASSFLVSLTLGKSEVTFLKTFCDLLEALFCSGLVRQGPRGAAWPLLGTRRKTLPSLDSTLPTFKMC